MLQLSGGECKKENRFWHICCVNVLKTEVYPLVGESETETLKQASH